MEFGYGKSQYPSHGRPTWISGNMPAQTTAKIVMASAKRLIELRQLCLSSNKIAEINAPAWPMPIHQTKLIIAKPQATGCVIAQMPTPFRNSHVTATSSTVAPPPAIPKSASQPKGVCGVSTMRVILSVTDLKVSPTPTTRYSPVAGSTPGLLVFTSLVAIVTSTLRRRVFHRRFFEFGIQIQHFCKVRRPGARVLVGEHLIRALIGPQLCNLARLVIQIPENDRRSRASLLASRHHFAVANRTILLVRFDSGRGNALHAVAAFFHHAARAYGNIGIARKLEAVCFVIGVEQEIEPQHLVGAVVGAIAGAHAAVVDHGVEAFRRVYRSAHRANLLARSILAMLAGHRLEVGARRRQIALEIGVDAQPLHVAPDAHLLLAHHRNVVLGITAHDAGVAAHAAVHVDRHTPLVLWVRPVGEERRAHLRRVAAFALVRKMRIRLVLIERRVANDAAFADRLIGFERVVAVALPADRRRSMVLEVALGDRHAPLPVNFLQRARAVKRRPGRPN